jgi:ABC-type oligopeptide transport system substrate-binding subunit
LIRFKERRSIVLAILVVAFALVAAACSSSDEPADETTTTTTTTAAPDAPTTTAAPDAPAAPVETPTEAGNTLSGLTVVDDRTFTVELNVADPEFPVQLAYTAFFPLPAVAYDNTLGYNKAPVRNQLHGSAGGKSRRSHSYRYRSPCIGTD